MSACYCEMSPDVDVRQGDDEAFAYTGLFELWPKRDPDATDNITAIGAWAWGLSRGLDLAFTIPEIDAAKSVATGCSRLAKTPLLACSRDERFAVCVPNQTGGGGVPLAKRDYGENVSTANRAFTHWYCTAYAKYAKEPHKTLTFDQHLLLACVAGTRASFRRSWTRRRRARRSCAPRPRSPRARRRRRPTARRSCRSRSGRWRTSCAACRRPRARSPTSRPPSTRS